MGTRSLKSQIKSRKRVVVYARVSTEEQAKGLYPSCDSQIEELEAYCLAKGWEVYDSIKDEGYSAGSLKRPGLSRLRWMVETDQIQGVVCTWYDRFTRSRDFYLVDKEFKNHNIDFITLHDRADRATASGRFMEMMLVAAKTYEREQTGEKVRSKLRMRAEKGMWNGGIVPFGFYCDQQTQVMYPDPSKHELVTQLFTLYVETSSDHAVRDWLKAHHIPAPNGKTVWNTSTIRDLLCNRRYVGEIEINKQAKCIEGLSDREAYHVVRAPHEPMISVELFERAQKIRQEKADRYANHSSKPRSYGKRRPEHVYLLHGIMTCSHCGHPMSPHYVFHKAGYGRRQDSYICHYVCSMHKKYGKDCDHRNRILAKEAEAWVLGRIQHLATSPAVVRRAMEHAHDRYETSTVPEKEAWARNHAALQENQKEIDALVGTITSGQVDEALLSFLNRKAAQLKVERETLLAEQRRLNASLMPLQRAFDADAFSRCLSDFDRLVEAAESAELQQLLRLMVRSVEWGNNGRHKVQMYSLNLKSNQPSGPGKEPNDWFDFQAWSDASGRGRTDTLLPELDFESSASANSATEACFYDNSKKKF